MALLPGEIKYATFLEATSLYIAARFDSLTRKGMYFVPYRTSDIATVSITVVVGSTNAQGLFSGAIVGAYSPDVSGVWFDVLQPWEEDNRGYNFRWPLPSEALAEGTAGQECQIEIAVTLASAPNNSLRQILRGPIAKVFGG